MIETPPEARLPIQTRIAEDDDGLVRDAIGRELDRGGQVFYVHNRVETIEAAAERVRRLVPQARVAIGHGQMAEGMLERVMLDFDDGRFDVLVCTTIIESGLDIPNANTIIIVRADTFGLAQLYQLRGRVGRSDRRAHAYLLHRRGMPLSAGGPQAAARDLLAPPTSAPATRSRCQRPGDPRRRQHPRRRAARLHGGRRLRDVHAAAGRGGRHAAAAGRPAPEPAPVRLDLPGSAYLPDDYVADSGAKLEAYRRFAGIRSDADAERCAPTCATDTARSRRRSRAFSPRSRVRLAAEAAGVPEVRAEERRGDAEVGARCRIATR